MKASTIALSGLLNLLPKILRQRYDDTLFGVPKGNSVIGDIEKKCDAEDYKGEYPLILLDGITDYVYNTAIRHFRGIYQVAADAIIPDRGNPITFEIIGKALRLAKEPLVDDTDDISSTVTGPVGAALDRFEDDVAGVLDDLSDNELRSSICKYTRLADNSVVYRTVAGNDASSTYVLLNGELPVLPAVGDTYEIIWNYYLIDAVNYITRLAAITDTVDIPQDWEELFVCGLRYYYEKQADQASNGTTLAKAAYNEQIKMFQADEFRKIGAQPKPVPRDIPTNLYGYE